MSDAINHCDKCGDIPHTQDTIHGKGRRVFTPNKEGKYINCTVCGKGRTKTRRLWATGDIKNPPPLYKMIGVQLLAEHLKVENYPHIPDAIQD